MKYIKKYELILHPGNVKYWKIKNDKNFDVSLYKIGAPENRFSFLKGEKNNRKYKYIYIYHYYDHIGGNSKWEWDIEDTKDYTDLPSNAEYEGLVNITKKDIKEWQFKKNIKKFNL